MIKLNEKRVTDFKSIEDQILQLGTEKEVCDFYAGFIKKYQALNEKFVFSQSFDADYVYAQITQNWFIRGRELFGIPFGVKDIFNTKVLPTEMGSQIWKGFKAGNNARVVDEISDAGGVIFSKTTTAEFAVHYIQAGKTLNPHNPRHITGTSSAGSAVAVACGALPISLATQTAGSIVRPASFCGTYGFKPSFGAYDRTGMLKTTDTLDTVGFMGSDIYGLRKTFATTFQDDPQYPYAKNYLPKQQAYQAKKRLRVGVITDQFRGYDGYDGYVKKDFDSALKKLGQMENVDLIEVDDVGFINEIHPLQDIIYCKSLSYYFKAEAKRGSDMSEVMAEMITLGNKVTSEQYMNALERQPELRAKFDRRMENFDFLITPSTASVAPLASTGDSIDGMRQAEKDDTCLIWTFFGYPALNIPAFWSNEHQLPFGLQLIAPRYADFPLLNFSEAVVEQLRK